MAKLKVLRDKEGREYSANILDPAIVKKEKLIIKTMAKVNKLHNLIYKEKLKIIEDIDKYLNDFAASYGEKWKGNTSLISFDGESKILINQQEKIQFDEKIQIAKQKIDKCFKNWIDGGNKNLQVIVNETFGVDKEGNIDKSKIFRLKKYNIKDKNWIEAMDIISDSINVVDSKRYLGFYVRNKEESFDKINLNFSTITCRNK